MNFSQSKTVYLESFLDQFILFTNVTHRSLKGRPWRDGQVVSPRCLQSLQLLASLTADVEKTMIISKNR